MVPPPTPNSPLKAPAPVAMAASRNIRDDIAGHTTAGVRSHIRSAAGGARAAHSGPGAGGRLLRHRRRAGADRRPRRGRPGAPGDRSAARAAWRAATAAWRACPAARPAEARRLVGVGGIAYAGSHGAELLEPGAASPRINPAFKSWEGRVKAVRRASATSPDLRRLRVRIEDKGPIVALHWRGAPDEEAALARVNGAGRRGRGGRAGDPLGAQGAGAAAAGRHSTRAWRSATWSSARACAPRCSAETTRPTSTPSTRSRRSSTDGALDAGRAGGRSLRRGPGRDRRARRRRRGRGPAASPRVLAVLADP